MGQSEQTYNSRSVDWTTASQMTFDHDKPITRKEHTSCDYRECNGYEVTVVLSGVSADNSVKGFHPRCVLGSRSKCDPKNDKLTGQGPQVSLLQAVVGGTGCPSSDWRSHQSTCPSHLRTILGHRLQSRAALQLLPLQAADRLIGSGTAQEISTSNISPLLPNR